jgi:DNA-binding CsgD family transcriptional regulator
MENNGRTRGNGERSFEEIGQELGITGTTAQALYTSGMRKLRSRRRTPAMQNLLRLVETKAMLR